jgi:hypothetical protein
METQVKPIEGWILNHLIVRGNITHKSDDNFIRVEQDTFGEFKDDKVGQLYKIKR